MDRVDELRAVLALCIRSGNRLGAVAVRAELDQLTKPARETAVREPDERR